MDSTPDQLLPVEILAKSGTIMKNNPGFSWPALDDLEDSDNFLKENGLEMESYGRLKALMDGDTAQTVMLSEETVEQLPLESSQSRYVNELLCLPSSTPPPTTLATISDNPSRPYEDHRARQDLRSAPAPPITHRFNRWNGLQEHFRDSGTHIQQDGSPVSSG
ncbi:hypothetical protein LTR41_011552 [Exophiala xenobiotica]|nr:hypothetical protein LTR41_011552 [Exophiala xenobiotica]